MLVVLNIQQMLQDRLLTRDQVLCLHDYYGNLARLDNEKKTVQNMYHPFPICIILFLYQRSEFVIHSKVGFPGYEGVIHVISVLHWFQSRKALFLIACVCEVKIIEKWYSIFIQTHSSDL